MIVITSAECARCGAALKVWPGIEDGPGADGDLYLKITRDGIHSAQALHKNTQICAEYLAEHG